MTGELFFFKRQGTNAVTITSFGATITNSHYLQFTTLKQHEIFSRKEMPSTGFGYIPLPDVVVEARAPVEFTYYVDLDAPWRLELKDGVVYVFAPPIRFNKPAIDVSAMTYEVRQGYLKSSVALENLKKSLSSLVLLRAKENIPLVRENGRKQIVSFVERWMARIFSDGRQYPVKVFFPEEEPSDEKLLKPGLLN